MFMLNKIVFAWIITNLILKNINKYAKGMEIKMKVFIFKV
jgi:hypothetical protein